MSARPLNSDPHRTPEFEMLATMVDYAIQETTTAATRAEALAWIFSDADQEKDGLFTFRYVCAVLELDPAEVRRRVSVPRIALVPRRATKKREACLAAPDQPPPAGHLRRTCAACRSVGRKHVA